MAASAQPTRESFEEAALFVEQVQALVQQHLSEEGRFLFPHFSQARGFLILAIALSQHHGVDKGGFKRFVDDTWKEVEATCQVSELELGGQG